MDLLGAILSITIIDLVLSGDNAAVIGLAIKNLPLSQRKRAAIVGAGGAILLRVIFTSIATLLIKIPFLNAIGGLILIWITWKLIATDHHEEENVKTQNNFWPAVGTIIVADLTMAFDNVMGVAGAAHGSVALVIFGLALSIPILVFGSTWLATLMNRYPIIIYIGGAVLAHTSFAMIFDDEGIGLLHYLGTAWVVIIPWLIAVGVLAWGWLRIRKAALAACGSSDHSKIDM